MVDVINYRSVDPICVVGTHGGLLFVNFFLALYPVSCYLQPLDSSMFVKSIQSSNVAQRIKKSAVSSQHHDVIPTPAYSLEISRDGPVTVYC